MILFSVISFTEICSLKQIRIRIAGIAQTKKNIKEVKKVSTPG